ncbi:MAG: hypothetical protein ACXWBP_02785 [Limisphaerales bacterium]
MKRSRKALELRETAPPYGLASSPAANPLEVKSFCESFELTQDTFTRLTGFSPRAVANWARGGKPSTSTARRLTELKRVFRALEKLVPAKTVGPWLKQTNEAFAGSTPLQVIERGELDRIWRMIYELESGEPT